MGKSTYTPVVIHVGSNTTRLTYVTLMFVQHRCHKLNGLLADDPRTSLNYTSIYEEQGCRR
jgi:hypothetical protein